MKHIPLKAAISALMLIAAASSSAAEGEWVYVGSQQRQIEALRFDTNTGKLTVVGKVAEGLRPTWVAALPQVSTLYAVDDDNAHEGSVTAFSVDRETGALIKVNSVAAKGNGTTNLYIDVPSMTLLAANYGSGSVSSFAVNGNGSLSSLISTIDEIGSGPNKRQASAHAHNAVVDPTGRYVLVPDLGADRVFIYDFDRATHVLSAGKEAPFILPPGSGPRHLVFGPDGRYAYLITELSADVSVFRWDASHGRLEQVQSLSISSKDFSGAKSGAEIAVSHDGRFVYVENRGENQMVVYRVDEMSGRLGEIQRIPTGGEKPWSFAIDASGKWVLVANQRSGKVTVFSIDTASGKLTDSGQSADVAMPVAIAYIQ